MKKKLTTLLLVLFLLLGMGLMLYPTVSDYWNSFHQSQAIANYAESVIEMDDSLYEEMWKAAVEYNRTLLEKDNPLYMSPEERQVYESLLKVSEAGVMGYVSIPSIQCELPIYHGTDEAVLQIAVGHLEGTSLPVGGESTHSVLSGHRGLPSAKLFTDLDRLKEGDVFLLQVLNETMTYEVDQIRIVLPTEIEELAIAPGKDYCTLVTCTPYGVNSHRMLVRGHRIANAEEAVVVRVTADALRVDPLLVAPVAAVPMLLILLLWLFTGTGGRGRKRSPKKGKRLLETKKGRRDTP